MSKIKLIILNLILLLIPVISLGATGHINGCTNTTFDTACCTKTFQITPHEGYTVVDVIVNGVSQGPLTSYTFTNIIDSQILEVVTEALAEENYTVTYNSNGGTGSMESQTFIKGVAQNLATNIFTREGYTFAGWSTTAGGSVEYANGASYTATANKKLYAVWKEFNWNVPTLGNGLTPVNWNGSSWVTTDEANWDYNYEIATSGHNTVAGDGTGKWANAQTADGSLYVWIPRYTYKITSGEHAEGNSWNSVDAMGTNKIEVKFSQGIIDDTSNSYKKHPAFTFGTDELKGIWVAKYETSDNGSGVPQSKPGVISWGKISVSLMYDYSYLLNRTLDSHLMRNSEWGAVAYLTNAIGKIPYINNSGTYVTGNAGGSQDASYASGTTNAWNTVNGVKASSTHNIYGIYDLSGGRSEAVSAYYTGGDSELLSGDRDSKQQAGSLSKYNSTKYVEKYNNEYYSDKPGDAIYETSSSGYGTTSWDGDSSGKIGTWNPVIYRGGYARDGAGTGIFAFGCVSGDGQDWMGFRIVLAIP